MSNNTSNGNNISNVIFEMTTAFINNLNAAINNFINKLESVVKDSDIHTEKQINILEASLKDSLARLENRYDGLYNKINTPPRNEELSSEHKFLSEGIKDVLTKFDAMNSNILSLTNKVKDVFKFIKIFIGVIGISILAGTLIMYYGNMRDVSVKGLKHEIEMINNTNKDFQKQLLEKLYKLDARIKTNEDKINKSTDTR